MTVSGYHVDYVPCVSHYGETARVLQKRSPDPPRAVDASYHRCFLELLRATPKARGVELWVPSDGYPSYTSTNGLGWAGAYLRSS